MKRFHATTAIKTVAPILAPMTKEEKAKAVSKFETKFKGLIINSKEEELTNTFDTSVRRDITPKPMKVISFEPKPVAVDYVEVNRRLDELIIVSDDILKRMKEQFGE